MNQRLFLIRIKNGEREEIEMFLPPSEEYAYSKGKELCENCGEYLDNVTAKHTREKSHGWEADARCGYCNFTVGTIVLEMLSIFGLEEDRDVLGGPWKVF